MLIILLFISCIFAPLPEPHLNTIAILPETLQNTRLNNNQLLQKLDVLSALPDDIQVKIISDTQNAQNAIQWLKMNKGSSHKLFSNPKLQSILLEAFKLSIMDKYYDADILKQILDAPNLVNWNPKKPQPNVWSLPEFQTHVLDFQSIDSFYRIMKNVDLSSTAGRQITEYTLLNVEKFIDENPGKSTDLLSLYSDILMKIIQSDSALTKKFTNDLSLADSYMVGQVMVKSAYRNKINNLKMILENPKVTEAIPFVYVQRAVTKAIHYNNNDFFTAAIGDPIISSRLDINDLFIEANENINMFALQKIINTPELVAKVSEYTINYYFNVSKKPKHLKLFVQNSHLSQQIDSKFFERKMRSKMKGKNTQIVSILLDAPNVWKDMKFSLKLKNAYNTAKPEMKQIIDKNELFKNKIDEIEG